MLVLALDTATPAVTAGIVELTDDAVTVLAERRTVNPKAHGELLTPHIRAAAEAAGRTLSEVDVLVCGAGPGPFTGLRVGMVTAAGFGHALGVPVYPVCSLDALAADADGPVLAVTDARRREVYWAAYDIAGHRTHGPDVAAPAVLAARLGELGVERAVGQGAQLYAEVLGLPVAEPHYPSAVGLVRAAAAQLRSGAEPQPLTPLYLRRPDAVEPSARKRAGQFRREPV